MPAIGGLLELFYHVGAQRGISAAARHLGLHQTTLSEHMRTLEQEMGGRLFERGDFVFTPQGRALFERVRPVFEGWAEFVAATRGAAAAPVRIAASELIQSRYMLELVDELERGVPGVPLRLSANSQTGMQQALAAGEIDIAISSFDGEPPRGTLSARVAQIPLVLLVPESSPVRAAGELWARGAFPCAVVVASSSEGLQQVFFRGLRQLGMKVPDVFNVHALPAVTELVARGRELGLSLDLPELVQRAGVRALPLKGFGPVNVSLWWPASASPTVKRIVALLRAWKPPRPEFAPAAKTAPPSNAPSARSARPRTNPARAKAAAGR